MATATNKNYLVIGSDGAELKTLKTLAAAKKLADAEGGSVLVDGECVYRAITTPTDDPVTPAGEEKEAPADEAESAEPLTKYRLKTLMNIRKGPDTNSARLGVAQAGTVVEVKEIRDDWLYLTDGTYILYGKGQFAEKVSG